MNTLIRLLVSLSLLLLVPGSLFSQTPEVILRILSNSENPRGENLWLEAQFTLPTGLHQFYQPEYFGLDFSDSVGDVEYPATENTILGLPSFEGTFIIKRLLKAHALGSNVKGRVFWQICNDAGVCLFPEERTFEMPLPSSISEVNALKPWILSELNQGPSLKLNSTFPPTSELPEAPLPPLPDITSLFFILIMAFLGGLLLNLMPCVLPVLSIKVLSLFKQAGENPRSRWAHAWAAAAGILSSMILLALVLIMLQNTGISVGWGVQFQNSWYVLSLILIVFLFALSLFDVFILNPPRIKTGKIQGLGGSYLTGLLTVVLATPCTAPFLGTALGLAFSSPWWVIILTFSFIGIGLALPFFLLLVIPGSLKFLPKPGKWMDILRGFMAFGLVGTGIWLLTVLQKQVEADPFSGVLWFLGLVLLGAWLFGTLQKSNFSGWKLNLARGLLLGMVMGGGYILLISPSQENNSRASTSLDILSEGWITFSEDKVAEALEAGQGIFIDFTADWCLTCQVNKAGALRDPEFLKAYQKEGIQLLRGDFTKADPVISRWLRKYQRAGVPFNLLLRPGMPPVIFPELLSKQVLLEALLTP